LWENFSLTEVEDLEFAIPKVELKNGVTRGQSCILGKLIMDRIMSREEICFTLLQWWKPLGNLTFKVLGKNRFLIEFDNPRDKE
jgi:hypothetical protein